MFTLDNHPEDIWVCRILGIDNGTTILGFTVLDYNILTKQSTLVHCESYTVPKDYKRIKDNLTYRRGAINARLEFIKEKYLDLLDEFNPTMVGCESPFSHLNVSTFTTLLKALDAFDNITYNYCEQIEFYRVSPSEAKAAVTHSGKYSPKKEEVHVQILTHPDLLNPNGIDLEAQGLDAMDSISVAMALISKVVI